MLGLRLISLRWLRATSWLSSIFDFRAFAEGQPNLQFLQRIGSSSTSQLANMPCFKPPEKLFGIDSVTQAPGDDADEPDGGARGSEAEFYLPTTYAVAITGTTVRTQPSTAMRGSTLSEVEPHDSHSLLLRMNVSKETPIKTSGAADGSSEKHFFVAA